MKEAIDRLRFCILTNRNSLNIIWDIEVFAEENGVKVELILDGCSTAYSKVINETIVSIKDIDRAIPDSADDARTFTNHLNDICDVVVLPLSLKRCMALRIAEVVHVESLPLKTWLVTGSITARPNHAIPLFDYFGTFVHDFSEELFKHRPRNKMDRKTMYYFIERLLIQESCLSANATHADNFPPLTLDQYRSGASAIEVAHGAVPKLSTSLVIHGDYFTGDKNMSGDNYKVSQAVSVGPNSKIEGNTINQIGKINKNDFSALASELSILRMHMKKDATSLEDDRSIGNVAAAESAALAGDENELIKNLKSAGSWAFKVSESIGVGLASAFLKRALGL